MKRIFIFSFLLLSFISNAQVKEVTLPDLLKIKFQEQFSNATDVKWSKFYRGKDNEEVRYEAEFFNNDTKYMVSYDKNGVIKALEKSILVGSLSPKIKDYVRGYFQSYKLKEATEIYTEEGKEFFNVGIKRNETDYLVLVFNKEGDFLYKEELK
ncbi:MAG: hypothetical protein KYX68_02690 [Flavobacterium sp.]|nr:hypothetical protein [Flavobacterium sp.]